MYIIYLFVVFIVSMIIMPKQKYVIGNSSIHGKGVICVHTIKKDESIGIVITRENNIVHITPYLGKYVNHKVDENTYLKKVESNGVETYYLHAKKIFILVKKLRAIMMVHLFLILLKNLNANMCNYINYEYIWLYIVIINININKMKDGS